MKLLKKYNDYLILKEGWVSDKLSNSTEDIRYAISVFIEPFSIISKKLLDDWIDEFDEDEVSKYIIINLKKSFNNLIKSIDKMTIVEDIETIYDDVQQSLVYFNDSLNKEIDNLLVSESIKSYNDFILIKEAQKSVTESLKAVVDSIFLKAKDTLSKNRDKYIDIFNNDYYIDTIREEAKKRFKKIIKKIEKEVNDIDIKLIARETKAKIETEKSSKYNNTSEYLPGIILKYNKKDGDTSVGEVASNQLNVEDGYINLISLDGKEIFIINKNAIIGESDVDGDIEVTPDDITNRLEDIKGDRKAMNKLRKFIDNELL